MKRFLLTDLFYYYRIQTDHRYGCNTIFEADFFDIYIYMGKDIDLQSSPSISSRFLLTYENKSFTVENKAKKEKWQISILFLLINLSIETSKCSQELLFQILIQNNKSRFALQSNPVDFQLTIPKSTLSFEKNYI